VTAHVRAPLPGLTPGEHALTGAVAHYLARVLRLRAGDAFTGFDPSKGDEADVTIAAVDEHDDLVVRVQVGELRAGAASEARAITFIQGLAKGDKCDAVVRDVTELAATRFIVAISKRSVVKLDEERAISRQARWTRIAQEAARQCGRSMAPVVDLPCSWEEALGRVAPDVARFCLYERAIEPLGPPLMRALANGAALAFAVGPEGGLDESEALYAKNTGWSVVSLGRLTLRTETVAASVLGAALVLAGSR
jgi:16S rRNA (uracil1498-N3)-methyltransferase